MNPGIAIVGTLDTKAIEIQYLKESIAAVECEAIVVDVGVFPQDLLQPDISRETVAEFGGSSPSDILDRHDRKFAVDTMTKGGARVIKNLYDEGKISGIISIGGGTGTHIASGIMHVLPVGFPKLIVSTIASRDMSGIIGTKDITIMHTVSDLAGLNFLTRKILSDAAAAIIAMAKNASEPLPAKPVVALTSFGPLNRCAFFCKAMLEDLGYEVVPFHAVGSGTMAMEDLIDQGVIHGVLDLALHEFADWMHGGYCKGIGPSRLERGGGKGIPRVILPGGLDMIAFECTSIEGVPSELRNRKFLSHDFRSFVRTTAEDLSVLAEIISDKLNQAEYPVTMIIPLRGWSKADAPGAPFYDPALDEIFLMALKSRLVSGIILVEVDANINDFECAKLAVWQLHQQMALRSGMGT